MFITSKLDYFQSVFVYKSQKLISATETMDGNLTLTFPFVKILCSLFFKPTIKVQSNAKARIISVLESNIANADLRRIKCNILMRNSCVVSNHNYKNTAPVPCSHSHQQGYIYIVYPGPTLLSTFLFAHFFNPTVPSKLFAVISYYSVDRSPSPSEKVQPYVTIFTFLNLTWKSIIT